MKTTIPLEIFSIEGDGCHIRLAIDVNGKSASMILDTGASRTVFDETKVVEFVAQEQIEEHDRLSTGLGTNSMESKMVVLDEFRLGKLKLSNYTTAVLDLTHVNQSYEKLGIAPIDGVLGGDILNEYKAVIDYGERKLYLTKV